MLVRIGGWPRVRRWLVYVRRVANVIFILFPAIMQASTSDVPVWGNIVDFVDNQGAMWILAAALGHLICTFILRRGGDPRFLAILDDVLGQIKKTVYTRPRGVASDHRVTLFIHRDWSLRGALVRRKVPWAGWLIPYVRPGHTSKLSSTRFLAPDDDTQAEGIAGAAWAGANKTAEALGLDDVSGTAEPLDRDYRAYAEATNVSMDWVKRKRPRSRSLMGFAVEGPDATIWGVVVFDSRDPGLDSEFVGNEFRRHNTTIRQIVEKL